MFQNGGMGAWQGKIRPKQDWSPAVKTPDPEALTLASGAADGIFWGQKGLKEPALPALYHNTQGLFLGPSLSHTCSPLKDTLWSWYLRTLVLACSDPSGPPYWDWISMSELSSGISFSPFWLLRHEDLLPHTPAFPPSPSLTWMTVP